MKLQQSARKSFLLYHFIIPLIAFLSIASILEFSMLDIWLAEHFYDRQQNRWPYREHWLAQGVIHKGGRYFIYSLGAALLGSWLWSFRSGSPLSKHRRPLAYLLTAGVTGPAMVTYLKSHTHIHCPWNLTLFNGSQPLHPVIG